MTLDEINKTLRQFVRETLGMPENSVRKANQKAPTGKQTDQFATVLITMVDPVGQDDRLLFEEDAPSLNVTEVVIGQRRLIASIQFFRGDAFTKACRLQTLISLSSVVTKAQVAGLGSITASAAKNITAGGDADWEERAQIDLEFYLIAKEVQSIPTFGRFPINVSTNSSTISSEVNAP